MIQFTICVYSFAWFTFKINILQYDIVFHLDAVDFFKIVLKNLLKVPTNKQL